MCECACVHACMRACVCVLACVRACVCACVVTSMYVTKIVVILHVVVVWQHYQNILSHELQSYRMVPGTLSVVVSDKVFFAGGYQGDKVFTGSITVAFVD